MALAVVPTFVEIDVEEALLSAADRAFADNGAVRLSAIAREAGVPNKVIYQRFGNRQVLASACLRRLERHLETYRAWVFSELDGAQPLNLAIDKAVRRGFALVRGHRGALLLRQSAEYRNPPARQRSRPPVEVATLLATAGAMIHARTGGDLTRIRLDVAAIAELVVRFGQADPRQLALLIDARDPTDPGQPCERAEDYLAALALSRLGNGTDRIKADPHSETVVDGQSIH